MEDRPSSDL